MVSYLGYIPPFYNTHRLLLLNPNFVLYIECDRYVVLHHRGSEVLASKYNCYFGKFESP